MYFAQVSAEWLPIVATLVVSTVLAIAATALTFAWLVRRQRRAEAQEPR
jgi:putative effector of murein hydrolase LrgA (UPF0299 family)